MRLDACSAGTFDALEIVIEKDDVRSARVQLSQNIALARNMPSAQLRANVPSTEINASELMWQFFKRHPLPEDGKK
jgi:hypothetical protein